VLPGLVEESQLSILLSLAVVVVVVSKAVAVERADSLLHLYQ
jgi:hypothetical protein